MQHLGLGELEKIFTGRGMNGTTFGQYSFTDLDYADDVSLLSEMLELLVPVLESFQEEAAPLGLEVNWQKTMVQALGAAEDVPPSLHIYPPHHVVCIGMLDSQQSRHTSN